MKHQCDGCTYFQRGYCVTEGRDRDADPGHHWCLRNDPDDCLDCELEVQSRTLAHLEREIFEAEKNALTDWHGRLKELHQKHFDAAKKYDQIMAHMQKLRNQTPSNADGLPF